jgi:hypothetical protein
MLCRYLSYLEKNVFKKITLEDLALQHLESDGTIER